MSPWVVGVALALASSAGSAHARADAPAPDANASNPAGDPSQASHPPSASAPANATTADGAPADDAAAPATANATAAPPPTEPSPAPTPTPATAPADAAPTTASAPTTSSPPATASTPATASAPATTPTTEPPPPPNATRPRFPRLVFAGGPMIGPHRIGSEDCRVELQRCEKRGSFFGVGVSAELRVRLFRPLYAHARGYVAGNVSPNDKIYTGLAGAGFGLGAYARRIFGRGEVLLLGAFGDNHFTPPFHADPTGRERWGRAAGLISAGVRQPFAERLGAELWGGLMIGPKSIRTVPSAEADRQVLTTFMVGLNLSADIIQ